MKSLVAITATVATAALVTGLSLGVLCTSEGKLATVLRSDPTEGTATRALAENSLWNAIDGEVLVAGQHVGTSLWAVKGALPVDAKVPIDSADALRQASEKGQLFSVTQVVHLPPGSPTTSAQIQAARVKSATCGCSVSEGGVTVEPAAGKAVSDAHVKAVGPIAREFVNPTPARRLALALGLTGALMGAIIALIRWRLAPLAAGLLFLTTHLVYKAASGLMWAYLGPLVLSGLLAR
ncbi:hypothetical protein AS149_14820 [Burkholderia cenocepacia]|nr:hypothetical protein AS149_14820 [Burkholderia cenocepacia]